MNDERSPTLICVLITILPPNQITASEVRFIISIIAGIIVTITFNALSVVFFRSVFVSRKRPFS